MTKCKIYITLSAVSSSRHGRNKKQENITMKTPKIYYLALVAFSIMTIFIGMVYAGDIIPPAASPGGVHGQGYPGMNMTNATMQRQILAGLEAKGVDISAAETLLQNSDTAAVSTWLATYFKSHRDERMNATARFNVPAGIQFHTEKVFTISAENLSGTDRTPHNSGMVKSATRCNTTAITSSLEQKGVDISAIKPALQKGDIAAVTQWLKSSFQAYLNEPLPRHTAWGHRNTTGLQGRP